MTLETIIAIVLGIAVLVFLIFGFSTGWGNLWDRITAFGGGSANIDTIVQGCTLACNGQALDAYCNEERTVKYGDEVEAWDGTGNSMVKSSKGTCDLFVKKTGGALFPGLNVGACSSITCTP